MDRATYPEVVSRYVGIRAGSPVNASLFGLAPRGVCLAAHVTTRAGALLLKSDLKFEISDLRLALAGRTVSPITCVSDLRSQNLSPPAGLFSVALVVARRVHPAPIWNLEFGISSDAPPLAGSL